MIFVAMFYIYKCKFKFFKKDMDIYIKIITSAKNNKTIKTVRLWSRLNAFALVIFDIFIPIYFMFTPIVFFNLFYYLFELTFLFILLDYPFVYLFEKNKMGK